MRMIIAVMGSEKNKGDKVMGELVREMTDAEKEMMMDKNKEIEHLKMENESLRKVIAWLNIKMMNYEKDR